MNQQDFSSQHAEPIVIGGVGGSGTRIVAQCLKEAGFHIGSDLNSANDNLWFTLLFKRIAILSSSEDEFDELLEVLCRGITGSGGFTKKQVSLIESLASDDRSQHSASWLKQRGATLLSEKAKIKPGARWGWKEPNSHIVLDRLADRLGGMKYIHVARNGLDMAHSSNQNQLRLWGEHFLNERFDITPYYSLKYWCVTHKRVLDIGKSMGNRFLLLNYDDFCANPENGVKNLFSFLGLESFIAIPRFTTLIKPPDSIGRFKRYGTDIFAEDDLLFVSSLGFGISSG
ncbi:MAG: sulfotransferase [Cyanobium sp. CZS 25K]|nr:sulfotransferase [Cyanobium sp. CZS25K]